MVIKNTPLTWAPVSSKFPHYQSWYHCFSPWHISYTWRVYTCYMHDTFHIHFIYLFHHHIVFHYVNDMGHQNFPRSRKFTKYTKLRTNIAAGPNMHELQDNITQLGDWSDMLSNMLASYISIWSTLFSFGASLKIRKYINWREYMSRQINSYLILEIKALKMAQGNQTSYFLINEF